MIERLSSNQLSSQLRTTDIGDTAIQTQEKVVDRSKGEKEENRENINFPKEKVKEIVDGMNKFMEASPTALKFEFHEKLNEYYVKIIDEKTKEVVREIPPKKMLDFYAAMTEFIGLMVDKKI
ncbi:flagellar protein FlaG [Mesobacillus subterraneus]|uniref:flagellar protein FlaG n=1 Tax=Mesobacillus subterraneus TaxID=285983 RepID=UPI001CFD969F|nr:flagellar protein FlaG [Mesobacillus subterraneus]WLR55549.1 flagellar protein FlaG [Mesobacillus subterraneus]